MRTQLEEELEASEEARTNLKDDLEVANYKIIEVEEDLYQSKSI
jgi:hypothetical protein